MPHCRQCESRSPAFTIEDAYCVLEVLGPMPGEALVAMADCGLSDVEIGRYFDLPADMITTMRDYWEIDGNH